MLLLRFNIQTTKIVESRLYIHDFRTRKPSENGVVCVRQVCFIQRAGRAAISTYNPHLGGASLTADERDSSAVRRPDWTCNPARIKKGQLDRLSALYIHFVYVAAGGRTDRKGQPAAVRGDTEKTCRTKFPRSVASAALLRLRQA